MHSVAESEQPVNETAAEPASAEKGYLHDRDSKRSAKQGPMP
jgi:hypothetical protein